jgi:spermidine/putrescine transport system ATP-binding protein
MEQNNIVSLTNVNKWYGENHVIRDLNIEIKKGEFLTLLGPSGCGKTTTIRMISGFETATTGTIKVEGENVEKKEPYQRNVNTVFQNYALFPNMNVFDNIAYGLKMKRVSRTEIKKRVTEMLKLVQLVGFERRQINQMSGGQKQRVAIARALINEPKVLLLDEPLGALDLKLRKQMQLELKRLQKCLQITFVYVTHDQEEALTMSDRIAVFNAGNLEQIGTPDEIYERPKTKFVAEFIGESNLFEAIIKESGLHPVAGMETGDVQIAPGDYEKNDSIVVSVRPESMQYSSEPVEGFNLNGVVKELVYVGSIKKMIVKLATGAEIKICRFNNTTLIEPGRVIYLYWNLNDGIILKEKSLVQTDTVKDLKGVVTYAKE